MKEQSMEQFCTQDMLRWYDELLACEKLGFYNSCEIITIFIYEKKTKNTFNFFSIFVMDERLTFKEHNVYITSKPIPVSERFSVGIQRRIVKVDKVRPFIKILCDESDNCVVNIGEGDLQIGRLELVPKTFVPKDSTEKVTLNRVLKNNFINGSYILEFFDAEERIKSLLDKKELKKITDVVFERIPIDLFTLSDRIGNFIIQFPSINTWITYETDEEERTLYYTLNVDKRLGEENNFIIQSELMSDNNIVGFGIAECKKSESQIAFSVGNSSPLCCSTLIDMDSGLILARQNTSFVRQISVRMNMGTQYGEQRLIFDGDGNVIDAIDISSGENLNIGQPVIRSREKQIEKRQYKERTDKLYQSREFRRYGGTMERDNALKDIIALMNFGEGGKVYLWDPYLTLEDLLETWYYTTTFDMILQAITSSEIAKKSGISVEEWIRKQRDFINDRSNHYGINLELRCQWEQYGYCFHDRFLMKIKDNDKPRVWSLGTSINSLGKKHHIIQNVEHPQMIVNAFEELWNELDSEECVVWKKG